MSDIDESAEKLRMALLKKGLSEHQIMLTVKKYKEGMKKIKKGKIPFDLVNKPKGSGEWIKKKVEAYRKKFGGT